MNEVQFFLENFPEEQLAILDADMVEDFFLNMEAEENNDNNDDEGYISDPENIEDPEPPHAIPQVPIIQNNWHRLRPDEQRLDADLLVILLGIKLAAEQRGEDVFEHEFEGDF